VSLGRNGREAKIHLSEFGEKCRWGLVAAHFRGLESVEKKKPAARQRAPPEGVAQKYLGIDSVARRRPPRSPRTGFIQGGKRDAGSPERTREEIPEAPDLP